MNRADPVGLADEWVLVVQLEGRVMTSVDCGKSWQPVFGQRLLRNVNLVRVMPGGRARVQDPRGYVKVLYEGDYPAGEAVRGATVRLRAGTGGWRGEVERAFGRGRFELDTRNGVLSAEG
ncbi:MAG: hypothetical protein IPI85_14990 [Dehalococcoidia bacterium]|nr:hypothetical protein [Dehalococcoidia bacterium]